MLGITDHDAVVAQLRRFAPSIKTSSDSAWSREPALRVIDCVLSLNRNYDRFVVPRLDRFEKRHPGMRSVGELRDLMKSYPSPHVFVKQTLDYDHEDRAIILDGVVDWLWVLTNARDELVELESWARTARPNEYTS